ncbi:MAG: hypothetical protein U9N49_05135 [Campylobacterota bacterium]|nr:hypothetical protein [Campylobacterota bacterium]
MTQTELIDKLKEGLGSLMDDGIFGLYDPSFSSSCLGTRGIIDLKESYFTLNTRRFDTAKRLKQITNLIEGIFCRYVHSDYEPLHCMKCHLSFGSAKPTQIKAIRRVGLLAHQKDRLWS